MHYTLIVLAFLALWLFAGLSIVFVIFRVMGSLDDLPPGPHKVIIPVIFAVIWPLAIFAVFNKTDGIFHRSLKDFVRAEASKLKPNNPNHFRTNASHELTND